MDLLIADDVIFRRAKRVELAAQYNVSLSAVREALARLAAEGLLDWEDHRGYRVASISADDLIDLTQTRIDLESLALRRAIARGDDTWKKKVSDALTALLERRKRTETIRGDIAFMLIITEPCSNPADPCGCSAWGACCLSAQQGTDFYRPTTRRCVAK
ncbi:GntR family transcriptional regulator [Bradyrhizobium sp. 191]|uniref:GntR family transcriptional regulator n=1 Tax=Bradyrhizobium sp. 191 TaxID=2782659 RepID=UPI001FFFEBDA|nr:GntR family transcriptional regulator [Bradyrhizobium sp. 191]UPJ64483.1 GntR family transcriptional regulator [Bradyrhizobium sp. 191]